MMSNKYQKALNWLMEGNDSCGTEWDLLQELVDKETPTKPYKDGKKYKCTKCVIVRVSGNRCPNCGQKIDWSDEDSKT